MSTARDRVIDTTELLQLILLALPLNHLLQARQVSKACRDLIDRSKYLRQIKTQPYVGVSLRLPIVCSISHGPTPKLVATFTLYHDKPITVCTNLRVLQHASNAFYKFEDGGPTASEMDFPRGVWGGNYSSRPHRFRSYTAYRWITLYPGVQHRMSWDFRLHRKAGSQPFDGDMGFTEIGKVYILRLRNDRIGHLIGTKKSLLARKDNGSDLKEFLLDKPLELIAENEVRFTVIP